MTSVAVTANGGGEGSLSLVGYSPSTSGWDGPPVTTNEIVPDGGYSNTSLSQLTRQNQASMQASISQPVLNSASNFQFNTGRMMTAGIDEFGSMICRALAGINILGLEPFGFMNQWADNLDAAAQQALTSATQTATGITGGGDSTKVAGTVNGIQQNLASNASAIAGLQTQATAGSTGGASLTDIFPNTLTGSIGPGWNLGGQTTSPWATANGVAGLIPNNAYPSGTAWALNTTLMMTTDHQVQMVAGSNGSTQAMTSLIVRATSNMSAFAYLNVFQNVMYLGFGSYSGGNYTFNDWTSCPISLVSGNTLTLTAQGNHYTAAVNGLPTLAHSDTAVNFAFTGANVSVGWLSAQLVDFFGSAWTGWDADSFNAGDVSSPPVVGTGWTMYQAAAGPVALPGSGWQALGVGAFDTQRVPANNVTITTPLNVGTVTIQKAGWYSVSFNVELTNAAGTSNMFIAGIFQQPQGGTPVIVRSGAQVEGNQVTEVSTSNVIYCNVGDALTPAVWQAGSNSSVGAATGLATYWEGALVSS